MCSPIFVAFLWHTKRLRFRSPAAWWSPLLDTSAASFAQRFAPSETYWPHFCATVSLVFGVSLADFGTTPKDLGLILRLGIKNWVLAKNSKILWMDQKTFFQFCGENFYSAMISVSGWLRKSQDCARNPKTASSARKCFFETCFHDKFDAFEPIWPPPCNQV